MSEVKKVATRASYGAALVELGKEHENLVVLDADLAAATQTGKFRAVFPERHIDCGIAECNMTGIAAGIATTGTPVFISSFAMFASGRNYEQVRNSIGYPHLNVKIGATHAGITVGEDGASLSYVKSKEKQSQEVGFTSSVYRFPATISEEELLQTIDFLNKDNEVDGYIVQMPLPKHIDARKITDRIDPRKDVDGFHPVNVGRMVLSLPSYIPATPYGIVTLIERSGIGTQGKHCVVIGRSDIVGSPVSLLMFRKGKHSDCTVTLCHSKTQNLKEICLQADISMIL